MSDEKKFKFPTEMIDLPSKGLVYPPDNPLSKGKVEMKYMTAKEEDILTNQSYIKNGTVIDKLLKSLTFINLLALLATKSPKILASEHKVIIMKLEKQPHSKIKESRYKYCEKVSEFNIPFSKTKKDRVINNIAGKNSPEIKPSRVLFGLIVGTILICPITFPKTKAKSSVKTEISRTVKKKLRENHH